MDYVCRSFISKAKPKTMGKESFEQIIDGWLVMSPNHPTNNRPRVMHSSFRVLKRDSIAEFIKGSGSDWKFWKKNYGFRCVRATSVIRILGTMANIKKMGL